MPRNNRPSGDPIEDVLGWIAIVLAVVFLFMYFA